MAKPESPFPGGYAESHVNIFIYAAIIGSVIGCGALAWFYYLNSLPIKP